MGASLTTTEAAARVASLDRAARRRETACGNGSLSWRAWGSGPPLLLLHGGYGSWAHWIHNIEALARERTLWVPDLPGYGDSAMPPREDHDAIAEVLAAGLRELVPTVLPLDVIAFSFGGVVAVHLAAAHADLIRRIILVATGGLGTPVGAFELTSERGLHGDALRAVLRSNLLELMLHDASSADELSIHIQTINRERARLRHTPLILPDKLLRALPEITAPIDAIWGEHDRPHPPAEQEAVLRHFRPRMRFRVIPGAGHWVMYERPDEFNQVASDLLGEPLQQSCYGRS